MTDTDRELLEMAARAAGYELDWFPDGTCDLVTKCGDGEVIRRNWDSLSFWGDAFALAVDTGMCLDFRHGAAWAAFTDSPDSALGEYMGAAEHNPANRYAAACRAITRAAAHKSEHMK